MAVNLTDLLAGLARRHGDQVALIEHREAQRRALSWRDLDLAVARTASGLAARGLRAPQRVLIRADGSVRFVISWLAALRLGLVTAPVPARTSEEELEELTVRVGSAAVLDPDDHDLARDGTAVISPRDPETVAALLATSATADPARLAVVSHRAILSQLDQLVTAAVVTAEDTVLGLFPAQHAFWLITTLGGVLGAGSTLVITEQQASPAELTEVIAADRVSVLLATPVRLRQLAAWVDQQPQARSALGSLRRVISAGAALSAEEARRFADLLGAPVSQLYGLSEAGPAVSLDGVALPGVEIRVQADPGEPGEVDVRSGSLFSGYWRDAASGPDGDGWFATGDIGYLDGAALRLLDRDRDLLTVSGFAVYPHEIEDLIEQMPGVQESAVVGLHDGDADRLAAVVVGTELRAEDVLAHCREVLPVFKRPGRVEIWDSLPRGATGKVRKSLVRERLAANR